MQSNRNLRVEQCFDELNQCIKALFVLNHAVFDMREDRLALQDDCGALIGELRGLNLLRRERRAIALTLWSLAEECEDKSVSKRLRLESEKWTVQFKLMHPLVTLLESAIAACQPVAGLADFVDPVAHREALRTARKTVRLVANADYTPEFVDLVIDQLGVLEALTESEAYSPAVRRVYRVVANRIRRRHGLKPDTSQPWQPPVPVLRIRAILHNGTILSPR